MKLPKCEVLKKLEVSLRLLGRDRNTVTTYCRVAGKFYDFVRSQPPGRTSEKLAEDYLSLRVTRDNVSASTQNHDLAALNALFAAFGRKLGNVEMTDGYRCPDAPNSPNSERR